MKKTLAAVAVLGAFAGSALAADVTLYGLVDYSLNYQSMDSDIQGVASNDKFAMSSGVNSGSRFGLKGTEDLGNGIKVGFVLENGFDADTGALGNDDRLFGREAQLYIEGGFGKVSFGRVGQLASSNGSFGLLGVTGPFSTGWGDGIGGLKFVSANGYDRFDNTITYVTPTFAGLTVYAQYSMDTNGIDKVGEENESTADRQYGIGAKYANGGLTLVGVVDSTNYATFGTNAVSKDMDDALTVTIGGNYDFEVAKVYFGAQYFTNAKKVATKNAFIAKATDTETSMQKGYDATQFNGAEGWGLGLGVGVPVMGGTAAAYVAYMDAEGVDKNAAGLEGSVKRWNATVGYTYAFSKRTSMYTALGYTQDKVELTGAKDVEPSNVEYTLGLIHKF